MREAGYAHHMWERNLKEGIDTGRGRKDWMQATGNRERTKKKVKLDMQKLRGEAAAIFSVTISFARASANQTLWWHKHQCHSNIDPSHRATAGNEAPGEQQGQIKSGRQER